MVPIPFMQDLLEALAAAEVPFHEIVHEHTSIPVSGHHSGPLAELDRQGFKLISSPRPDCSFLSLESFLQIELTPPHVLQHEGFRVKTCLGYTRLCNILADRPKFFRMEGDYDINKTDLKAAMYKYGPDFAAQFVWRENDVFPPRK